MSAHEPTHRPAMISGRPSCSIPDSIRHNLLGAAAEEVQLALSYLTAQQAPEPPLRSPGA